MTKCSKCGEEYKQGIKIHEKNCKGRLIYIDESVKKEPEKVETDMIEKIIEPSKNISNDKTDEKKEIASLPPPTPPIQQEEVKSSTSSGSSELQESEEEDLSIYAWVIGGIISLIVIGAAIFFFIKGGQKDE